jgi:hypothetical protein
VSKRKKVKITAYLEPNSLRLLATHPNSVSLNYTLATFASVLAERGRRLAANISEQQWALLRDALDEDCWELPDAGMTWTELVRQRVEERMPANGQFDRNLLPVLNDDERSLLQILDQFDNVDALAVLTAVRHCEQLGPVNGPTGRSWWEPADRLARRVEPVQVETEQEIKPAKKRKKGGL